jgi:putative ABC transport system permease protein
MSRSVGGWRVPLRMARRDALRHRGRSLLALIMITLPVLGVVAADILIQTSQVDGREGLDRRIGTVAAAKVTVLGDQAKIKQAADPGDWHWVTGDGLPRKATLADIEGVIGDRPSTPAPTDGSDLLVRTEHGRESVFAQEVDPRDGLTDGLYRLTLGRWPTSTDEVVVNQALADRGPAVGDSVQATGHDGTAVTRKVVGIAESTSIRSTPIVLALPDALPLPDVYSASWLVGGKAVTWADVQKLNDLGVVVTSRQVVLNPGDIPDPTGGDGGDNSEYIAVAALIAAMALIEVVLLAGPSFAVGARKQQRSLALLAASGGTPRQARRVILAGGLVLGTTAAVTGVVLGIGVAWALQPVVQRFSGEWLGPFDVPWLHLLGIAAFGLVSAFLAAVVPAWIASRQDVVAVLAGRRGDPRPSLRSPLIGAVVLAAGIALAVYGARGNGTFSIAISAIVCVIGMLFLVPVVVAGAARLGGRLPLALRFAARDAARHRTRTTPAVAAVAATVAGVVALGISTASDEKQNRETYTPITTIGDASVGADLSFSSGTDADWPTYRRLVAQAAPAAAITEVRGVSTVGDSTQDSYTQTTFVRPGGDIDEGGIAPWTYYSALNTEIVVSDGTDLPGIVTESTAFDVDAAREALAAGKAVVLSSDPADATLKAVDIDRSTMTNDDGTVTDETRTRVPAVVLEVSSRESAPFLAALPPAVARKAHLDVATTSLQVAHPDLSKGAQADLQAALGALNVPGSLYVERGYQADAYTVIVQWVLAALGAILMLGGTLTATFLALSDARPDLATLAAVGAAPRTRRGVGAAYALVVGLVGSVLGALVGAIPGLAVVYPLTASSETTCDSSGCTSVGTTGPFFDVPWLMIVAVVVGLPLVTALIVGLFTRSRLPMVARLS